VTASWSIAEEGRTRGAQLLTVAGKAFPPGVMKLGPWRFFTLASRSFRVSLSRHVVVLRTLR